ncbi:MAG: M23 family metallopeptidase [Candidatus Moranbacteria bacterium]|nr:M23 family metallopeptidase [Candidatus Moranbacteria bacterium]
MKKYLAIGIIFLLAATVAFSFFSANKKISKNEPSSGPSPAAGGISTPSQEIPSLDIPLVKARERITKKPFGIYVTPQNSPVQPEKFTGFHTGTDFEIFAGEENQDVPVFAICDGKVIFKGQVNGYGGVIIESCAINNEAVTVLYGHLSLQKSPAQINAPVKKGELIAILGEPFSRETSGERKHLHLGIHKGGKTDFRGYVQNERELSQWLDFEKVFGLR